MSQWSPCKRQELIRRLARIGFTGPFSETKHQFMIYHGRRMAVPTNPEYSVPQLRLLLREVGGLIGRRISAAEWEKLGDE